MKCPKCLGVDYKSQGWFERHMMKEHDWTPERAAAWWGTRCPKCGAVIVNPLFCIACTHWLGGKHKDD